MLPYVAFHEMPHKAAFHLGPHCFPKYLFTSNQNEKVKEKHIICWGIQNNFYVNFSFKLPYQQL